MTLLGFLSDVSSEVNPVPLTSPNIGLPIPGHSNIFLKCIGNVIEVSFSSTTPDFVFAEAPIDADAITV